jgi:regulator of replication initiation timing
MKTYIIAIAIAATLLGCDTKEKAHLKLKVDSLQNALVESKKTEVALNEVGIILDSIDINRHVLHVRIVEGITYADYVRRLNEINTMLENNLKGNKAASSATINRLKADIETKSKEIVALQLEVINLRDQNGSLTKSLNQKDSTISSQKEMITLKSGNVTALEGLVKDINDQNRVKVAGLYFDQAQALETAANRTKFAPRKKKETRREALELYKLSFSLGNTDAEAKIQELEKKLS